MKKRFTDADKWEDSWFCEQPSEVKLFWLYLCDRCDHAGVWEVNWRLAKFHLPSLNQRTIESALVGRITQIKGGKAWFMSGFISFQYPIGLSTSSNAHKAIRTTMASHGISPDSYQCTVQSTLPPTVLSRVQSTLQDKDKDKAQDMDTDKDKREEPIIDPDEQDIFAPSRDPKTRPMIDRVRAIPGLQKLPKDMEALVASANMYGIKNLTAAVDECNRSGQKAYENIVTPIAARMKHEQDNPPEECLQGEELPADLNDLPIGHQARRFLRSYKVAE